MHIPSQNTLPNTYTPACLSANQLQVLLISPFTHSQRDLCSLTHSLSCEPITQHFFTWYCQVRTCLASHHWFAEREPWKWHEINRTTSMSKTIVLFNLFCFCPVHKSRWHNFRQKPRSTYQCIMPKAWYSRTLLPEVITTKRQVFEGLRVAQHRCIFYSVTETSQARIPSMSQPSMSYIGKLAMH